ncbi:MAG: hypothetical protein J2P31_04630 [Blastocatellia bacterium]|nr:hypothetical protein [Blastocatellia bacterium]
MSNLLDTVIAAHGGLGTMAPAYQSGCARERWRRSLELWSLKGHPGVFSDVQITADPHRQYVEYSPFHAEWGERHYNQGGLYG